MYETLLNPEQTLLRSTRGPEPFDKRPLASLKLDE